MSTHTHTQTQVPVYTLNYTHLNVHAQTAMLDMIDALETKLSGMEEESRLLTQYQELMKEPQVCFVRVRVCVCVD